MKFYELQKVKKKRKKGSCAGKKNHIMLEYFGLFENYCAADQS